MQQPDHRNQSPETGTVPDGAITERDSDGARTDADRFGMAHDGGGVVTPGRGEAPAPWWAQADGTP